MAAWWLGHRPDKRAAPAMLARLRDATEDPALRRTIGFALGALGSTRPVPALIRLLRADPEERVREAAAYALAFIGDRRAFEPLLGALENKSEAPLVRGQAAEGLAYQRDPRAVAALLASLDDPAPEVRFWAAFALGEVAGEEATAPLERLASDATVVPRWWAVNKEAADAIRNIRERLRER
jgi:HEAT repeat protein